MDFDDISKIVNLMSEHGLGEFELEEEGHRISIKRGAVVTQQMQPAPLTVAQQAVQSAAQEQPQAPEAAKDENLIEITAPFVGTFYKAPSPDSEPYVSVGQEVGPDTALCILEAMKVMNEIKAETRGIVKEILVDNAEPVQYGQTLFKIQKI